MGEIGLVELLQATCFRKAPECSQLANACGWQSWAWDKDMDTLEMQGDAAHAALRAALSGCRYQVNL